MAKKFGVHINKADMARIKKAMNEFKHFDKYADKEMSVAVKGAKNEAVQRFKTAFNQISGQGRGSITVGKTKRLNHYVRANKKYMPYLEFGTITKVDLSWLTKMGIDKEYAQQFKGKGLKKNGGIKAGHYFFPSVDKAFKEMIKRMRKRIDKLTKA